LSDRNSLNGDSSEEAKGGDGLIRREDAIGEQDKAVKDEREAAKKRDGSTL